MLFKKNYLFIYSQLNWILCKSCIYTHYTVRSNNMRNKMQVALYCVSSSKILVWIFYKIVIFPRSYSLNLNYGLLVLMLLEMYHAPIPLIKFEINNYAFCIYMIYRNWETIKWTGIIVYSVLLDLSFDFNRRS